MENTSIHWVSANFPPAYLVAVLSVLYIRRKKQEKIRKFLLRYFYFSIDRQNQSLDSFFDPHHEAILRLIQLTIENAHKYGAWCGICGELGADMELTAKFIQMGIDELSVSPGYTLELRKRIREC